MAIKACYSRWKLALMAALIGIMPLAGFAIAALEIYQRTTGERTGPIDVEFAIYVPLLLSLTPFSVRYLRHMFDREPVLVVDEAGVFDRRWVDCAIPWQAIASSAVVRIGSQSSIWLGLSTPLSEFTTGGSKRLLARLGAFSGMLALSCTELNVSAETLQSAIDQHLTRKADAAGHATPATKLSGRG